VRQPSFIKNCGATEEEEEEEEEEVLNNFKLVVTGTKRL